MAGCKKIVELYKVSEQEQIEDGKQRIQFELLAFEKRILSNIVVSKRERVHRRNSMIFTSVRDYYWNIQA